MKSLMYIALTVVLELVSAHAHAQLLCESRLNQIGNSQSVFLTETSVNGRAHLESQIAGYNVKVIELISKDQSNPTLSLNVKDSKGIILTTMLPAPGEQSGNAFIRTDVRVSTGYLVVKCISHQ
nr:hypothetical protein HAGR004_41040 [Bdellovibrio sp. HAGR004]